jgi:hypothetical protein
MNRLLAALTLSLSPATMLAETPRVGVTLGGSLLTQRDPRLTPVLPNDVTGGPTLLVGLTGEVALDADDRLALDLVVGPYDNDVARSCLVFLGDRGRCGLQRRDPVVTRALLWGMEYARAFGGGGWRPYVTAGYGVKIQWLKSGAFPNQVHERYTRATVTVGLGLELARRRPFRIEARSLTVLEDPLFPSNESRFELHLRAAFLLPLR